MRTAARFNPAILLIGFALVGCGYAEWPPPGEGLRDVNRTERVATSSAPGASTFRNAAAVIVSKGDTVWTLSKRHGVSMRAIIEANGLRAPFHLSVGQRIVLPRNPEHEVVKGDTLSGIAVRYDANMHVLARLNGLKPPYTIYTSQRLRLPRRGGVAMVADASKLAPKLIAKPPAWATKQTKISPKPTPVTSRTVVSEPIPKPPPVSGKGFRWPVSGRVVSDYGAKPKGFHNDGINIAAPRGMGIKAAQNGVVVYAGNELRGFGNLLLIKHSGGWVTAYAHADSLLVKRGDRVLKGQRVATVGTTGSVTKPQLHFEIRKGRQARDPRKYLRRA